MSLVARSDSCGRVWIEDAEKGRFPPHGIYVEFQQHERKREVAATFALARKLAAADAMLAALKEAADWLSPEPLQTVRAAIAKAEGA